MPARAALADTAEQVIQPFPDSLSNCGPQAEAMFRQAEAQMEQAKAWHRIADVGEQFVATIQPMSDAVQSLSDAQRKLCAFLVGHRLKLALSVPTVLVAIGALSPNAAGILAKVLQALGAT